MVQFDVFTYYLTSFALLFMTFTWVTIYIAMLCLVYLNLQLWPNIGSVKPRCGLTGLCFADFIYLKKFQITNGQ